MLEKLNIITEGYPSKNSETAGLLKDQFVKTPRSSKWYDMYSEKKYFSRSKVFSCEVKQQLSRIARHALPSAPSSPTIQQDTLRRSERPARNQSIMCNQAAGLSRCLTGYAGSHYAGLIRRQFHKYGEHDISPQRQLPGLFQSWNLAGYPHCFTECSTTHALSVSGSATGEARAGDLTQ